MDNKDHQRKALALLVISIILFIYLDKVLFPYLNPKSNKDIIESNNATTTTSSVSKENELKSVTTNKTTKDISETTIVSAALPSEQEILANKISIDSPLFHAEISKRGGRLINFRLKNFKKNEPWDTEDFNMVTHKEGVPYSAGIFIGQESDNKVSYEARIEGSEANQQTQENIVLSKENPNARLILKGKLESGREIEKVFSFNFDNYLFSISAEVLGEQDKNNLLSLEWVNQLSLQEAGILDTYNVIGFVWLLGDMAHRLPFSEMKESKQKSELSCVNWVGLGNKYFASAIVSEDSFSNQVATNKDLECAKGTFPVAEIKREDDMAMVRYTPGPLKDGTNKLELKIYSGPKSYNLLSDQGLELKRLIDLGKTGFISAPLLSILNFLNKFVNNYGLSIVLLTICVKLCLYPLNTSQYRQMKAMQNLKPEMDRIKENISDKKQQQVAMMELYKKKGVNPLGGCLPALVQMPIFIGLYSALMLAVELRHAPYGLWVHDLSAPDKLMIGGVGIPVLVVLFTASIMVQQWITPTTADPAQKKAMMIMPIVMFFMFMGFPAGLALYWLTNNLISIGQQQAIQYSDKSGKSGLTITMGVAVVVFFIAYLGTLF